MQDKGADTIEANQDFGFAIDALYNRQRAEILFDPGLCKVRLTLINPDKLDELKCADLKTVERIRIEVHGVGKRN